MKPITFRALFTDKNIERELTGWPTGVPGLLVSEHHESDLYDGYTIVHHRSGSLVGWAYESPEAALASAQALAGLTDWTVSGPDVQAALDPAGHAQRVACVQRYGGRTGTREDGSAAGTRNEVLT